MTGPSAPQGPAPLLGKSRPLEIGIVTKGKPTLGMVITSLLLQEACPLRIYVVDTGETPVINREDVMFSLRLAFDREVQCGYEYFRDRERPFSGGKFRLLENLKGPLLAFMDDDIVLPPSSLATLGRVAAEQPCLGYVAPLCKNAFMINEALRHKPHYSPGGVVYQDEVVRKLLMEYYSSTVDVLDRPTARESVWETAFLTELFGLLGRERIVREDCVSYHLDYAERPDWNLAREDLVSRSLAVARDLVQRFAPAQDPFQNMSALSP